MRETFVQDLVQGRYVDAMTPLRSICSRIYAHRSYNKTRNKTRTTCAHKWHGAGRTRAFLSPGAHLCTSAERPVGIEQHGLTCFAKRLQYSQNRANATPAMKSA